jgi:L-lactate dehydrogenase complex protein LldG
VKIWPVSATFEAGITKMSSIKTSQAREQILGRIRKALNAKSMPMPFPEADHKNTTPLFNLSDTANDESFAGQFIQLGGKYIFCDQEQEMLEQLHALCEMRGWEKVFCSEERLLQICRNNKLDFILPADNADDTADACITGCEAAIARTGSFLISSRQHLGRVSPVFYPVHLVVLYRSQLVTDIASGLELLSRKYKGAMPSMISLQTGPSRTADIEKTLVTGIHGPKEVFCFYVNA